MSSTLVLSYVDLARRKDVDDATPYQPRKSSDGSAVRYWCQLCGGRVAVKAAYGEDMATK